ncbi:MAG: UDP-N-acetylmuramate dehydrogenase [Armatimonadota bacterium]
MKAIADYEIARNASFLPHINGELRISEPMFLHTSFRIGGPADVYAVAHDQYDLMTLIRWAENEGLPVFIIGAGTNLLVSDEGIRGLVISMSGELAEYRFDGSRLTAGGAVKLPRLIHASIDNGLSGIECLAGIPGTVGGAVCMNAGTCAGCAGDSLESVTVIDSDAKVCELSADDLNPRYRGSLVKDSGMLVTHAVFNLRDGNPDESAALVRKLLEKRRTGQPSGHTAGSVFKNPQGDFAGRILELAGAKGLRVGGAKVSDIHANFIENAGGATADDVYKLVQLLQSVANDKFGVILEPEIQLVGEWI